MSVCLSASPLWLGVYKSRCEAGTTVLDAGHGLLGSARGVTLRPGCLHACVADTSWHLPTTYLKYSDSMHHGLGSLQTAVQHLAKCGSLAAEKTFRLLICARHHFQYLPTDSQTALWFWLSCHQSFLSSQSVKLILHLLYIAPHSKNTHKPHKLNKSNSSWHVKFKNRSSPDAWVSKML